MTFRDSSVLAYTKFRTRKVRSILVIIGSASITALVLFFSIAATGLKNSVTGKFAPLESLNLLQIQASSADAFSVKAANNQAVWDKLKKDKKIDSASVKAVYYSARPSQTNPAELSDLTSDTATAASINGGFYGQQLNVSSTELIQPYVAQGQSLTVGSDGVLPVVVSADIVNRKYQHDIDAIKDVTERVKKVHQLQQQYIGKAQTMTMTYVPPSSINRDNPSDTSQQKTIKVSVKIVGFTPASSGFISSLIASSFGPTIETTFDAAARVDAVKDIIPVADTLYLSFDTRASRATVAEVFKNDFSNYATIYGDITGSVQGIFDSAKDILKWVVIAMLIFVTLPMMSTMGKILADSQRETGVFRAIGARNKDITKIYATYSAILATLAFVVGVLIASIIAGILSAKYGKVLGAQLTEITGSANILRVTLYGVSIVHWVVLYVLLLVSAVLGATIPVLRTLRKDPILAMRDE